MTGGMISQRNDALHIIYTCRAKSKSVVVGGPDVTASPDIYKAANFQVLGEAEAIMVDFISGWRNDAMEGVFEEPKSNTDITKSLLPRFDLLKLAPYLHLRPFAEEIVQEIIKLDQGQWEAPSP